MRLSSSLPFLHTYSSRHLNRAGPRGPCWHQGIAFVGPPKKEKECVSNLAESYSLLWLVACCHVNPGHMGALGTVTGLCTVKTLLGYSDFAKIDES